MSVQRRFEVHPAFRSAGVLPPRRASAGSAGYDLAAAADTDIAPGAVALVPTGLVAWMAADEFLSIHIRSSVGVRRHLALANGTGIVDSDYAGNPDNGGHIQVALRNLGPETAHIRRGERIAQGIFQRYLLTEGDMVGDARQGGFGSSGT